MTRQIRFGGWCFDPDTHLLTMGEERRMLEPRVSRLLEFLLAHPGETLSHDQLVDAVWDGRVVSDEAVRRAVSTLRHALAPDGSDHCIRTVHKKGYVALFDASQAQAATPRAQRGASSPQRYVPPLWQRIAWALSLVFLASALTLTLLAYRRTSEPPPQSQAAAVAPTLAVLPFINLSAEADTDFLADGVSEELRDTL
ncbi:MAG TPA: winged helix-turn-helix domain-containing protein, partial [Pseudomonadales bacterium]|nr:winged helix-turn-helix domain-containing protein [Pseudomonadales bacterium]